MAGLSSERSTILVTALGLSVFLLVTGLFPDIGKAKTPRKLEAGKTITANLTLVTADAHDLACAGDHDVAGARCAFRKDGSLAEVGSSMLAPYMTTDNVLFLVPDLFSQPALVERLKEEPPSVGRSKLRRFTARCKMELVEEVKGFYVRWKPTSDWSWRNAAWVGRVSDCKI